MTFDGLKQSENIFFASFYCSNDFIDWFQVRSPIKFNFSKNLLRFFKCFYLTNNCRPTTDPISLTNKDRKANFFLNKSLSKSTLGGSRFGVCIYNRFLLKNGSNDLHVKIQAKHETRLYKKSIIDTDPKSWFTQVNFR